jgi:hypothetical protein
MQNKSSQGGRKRFVVENQDLVSVSRMLHHQRSYHPIKKVMTQNNTKKVLTPNQRKRHETIQRTSHNWSKVVTQKTRGVSHCGLAIYIKKYLKAKQELMETQIFHQAKI